MKNEEIDEMLSNLYSDEKKKVLKAFRESKLTHDEFIVKFILELCNDDNKMKPTITIMIEVLGD